MEPWNGRAPTNEWAAWVPPDDSIPRVSERDHNGSRSETTDGKRVPQRDPLQPANGSRSETTYKTKSSYQAEPHGQGDESVLVDLTRRATGLEAPAILGKLVVEI
jgi:hypothetical protein